MKRLEPLVYVAVMAILGVALIAEGRRTTELLAHQAVTPKALYALLSNPQVKVQIVDLRAYDDDHYVDTHIPGAIPLPSCDETKAPESARDRVYPYVSTIIVTDTGDAAAFEACRAKFGQARLLEGGMEGWSNANLPEDTGDYAPPKNAAGGGCL
ncbi:MAG: rhodanese-like domain-containing protein [Archangium sp.]|nr:rhodanese-like domain-containing protein [Archangium sp.]